MPFVSTFAKKLQARSRVTVETPLKLNAVEYSTIQIASWNEAEVLGSKALGKRNVRR